MPELENEQLFDLYHNQGEQFIKFEEMYRISLNTILMDSIKNWAPMAREMCLHRSPDIDDVRAISRVCGTYITLGKSFAELRREIRKVADEVDPNLLVKYSILASPQHWENVAFYIFVVSYLQHIKKSKLDPSKC